MFKNYTHKWFLIAALPLLLVLAIGVRTTYKAVYNRFYGEKVTTVVSSIPDCSRLKGKTYFGRLEVTYKNKLLNTRVGYRACKRLKIGYLLKGYYSVKYPILVVDGSIQPIEGIILFVLFVLNVIWVIRILLSKY
jgi:hypothetical protein